MGGGPGEAGPRGAQGKGLRGCLSPAGAERGLGWRWLWLGSGPGLPGFGASPVERADGCSFLG